MNRTNLTVDQKARLFDIAFEANLIDVDKLGAELHATIDGLTDLRNTIDISSGFVGSPHRAVITGPAVSPKLEVVKTSPRAASTPEQLASRQLQGRYLALVRQLPESKRKFFAKVAKEKGREAAIREMQNVLAPKKPAQKQSKPAARHLKAAKQATTPARSRKVAPAAKVKRPGTPKRRPPVAPPASALTSFGPQG